MGEVLFMTALLALSFLLGMLTAFLGFIGAILYKELP